MVRLHLVHSQCRCLNSVPVKHSFCTRNRPSWVVEQLYWLPSLSYPFDPGAESQHSGFRIKPQIAGRYIVFTSDRFGRQDVYLFDA